MSQPPGYPPVPGDPHDDPSGRAAAPSPIPPDSPPALPESRRPVPPESLPVSPESPTFSLDAPQPPFSVGEPAPAFGPAPAFEPAAAPDSGRSQPPPDTAPLAAGPADPTLAAWPAQPTSGAGQPPGPGYPAQPGHPAGYPGQAPPGYPYGGFPPPPGPSRRRGLIITSVVLAVVLLLCGGGGTAAYFLITRVGSSGRPTPAAAVDGFLNAVLREHDADKANTFVCSESRDKAALNRKISELQSYEEQYKSLRYSWSTPTVQSRKGSTATLTVPVKITTADDRVAEKRLKFVAVNESGWWVCEVGDAQ